MSRLPVVNYKVLSKVLSKLGFEITRQRGSHVIFRHSDGRSTTVPNHPGRDISKPLLSQILREIEVSVDELLEELKKL